MQRVFSGLIVIFLFFNSCSKGHQSALQARSEKLISSIAIDLEKVRSAEDLQEKSYLLKQKILKLTKLMIEIDKKSLKSERLSKSHLASDKLLYEVHRLSKDSKCLEILKDLQRDALDILDRYDNKKKKA